MAKYKLMIDAGHGGKDPGAVSKFGREEDWTLKISLYQYERYKQLGVSVGITRTADVDLTEDQRVKLAQQGEYCFSNHLNAGGGDRAEVIHSIFDNGKLAEMIKMELLAAEQNAVKIYSRKHGSVDYYYMHRRTGATKTNIIEYAFIDNEADYKHFAANWQAYAEAPVKAFCKFIGHPYSSPKASTPKAKTITLNETAKKEFEANRDVLEKLIAGAYEAGIFHSDHSSKVKKYTDDELASNALVYLLRKSK